MLGGQISIAILSLVFFVVSIVAVNATPNKKHVKIQVVFLEGQQSILVPGSIKIDSTDGPMTIFTESGSAERDLVCDDATSFTVTPNDKVLVPDPKFTTCNSAQKIPGTNNVLVSMQVKLIDVNSASIDNLHFMSTEFSRITAKQPIIPLQTGFTNLGAAIRSKDTGSIAHTAAALAGILREKNEGNDADFLSSISYEALGQKLDIGQPLVFDQKQNKLVPSQQLSEALTDYAKSKGLTSASNRITNYGAVFKSLSGHSYMDLTTKALN
jgi:hypothetical protein